MGRYDSSAVISSGVYTGTVGATKVEVNDNPNAEIYSVHISNTTAAVAYLQVFDLDADNVTVGTTAPTYAFGVPASGSVNLTFGIPILHTTGFTIASTTTRTGSSEASQEVTIIYTSKA